MTREFPIRVYYEGPDAVRRFPPLSEIVIFY